MDLKTWDNVALRNYNIVFVSSHFVDFTSSHKPAIMGLSKQHNKVLLWLI